MKNTAMLFLGVMIILILGIGVFVYLSLREGPTILNFDTTQKNTVSSSISVSIDRQVEETDWYVIEKNMPIVSGGNSPLVDAKINSTLQQSVDALVRNFKQEIEGVKPLNVEENLSAKKGANVTSGAGTGTVASVKQNIQKHSLSISVTKSNTVDNKFLTLTLADFSYVSGAAHPITTTLSYNFDLSTGKQIRLEDIFDGGKNYLGTISILAKENLKIQLSALVNENNNSTDGTSDTSTSTDTTDSDIDGMNQDSVNSVFFEEGADPREENYSVYLIEKEGIRFIFGQYQVAPYVYGEQEVFISYAELTDVIRPSFVFSDAFSKTQ